MPNIAFAPAPRTDPYAGRAGEYLADIITSIGKIGMVRRDRREREEIFDIVSSGGSHDQINKGIVDLANSGNRYAMNLINQASMSEIMKPETERLQDEANLEYTKQRTEYMKTGGARGGDENQLKFWTTERNKAAGPYFDPKADPESGFRNKPVEPELYDLAGKKIKEITDRMNAAGAGTPAAGPGQVGPIASPAGAVKQTSKKPGNTTGAELTSSINQIDNQALGLGNKPAATGNITRTETNALDQELAGYIEKLDDDSKAKLKNILDRGDENEIKRAMQKMRNVFGKP